MTKKTLVLGLGNDLFGDDGVGIHVIRRMRAALENRKHLPDWFEHTVFEECSVSGLALLDVIVDYDRLILIDTIKKRSPVPGRISLLKTEDIRDVPGPSPHYVSLPQAVEIGRGLGLKVPAQIDIVAVEAKNLYDLGEELTPEMESAIPEIISHVEDFLSA